MSHIREEDLKSARTVRDGSTIYGSFAQSVLYHYAHLLAHGIRWLIDIFSVRTLASLLLFYDASSQLRSYPTYGMNDMSSKRLKYSTEKSHILRDASTVTLSSGASNRPRPKKISQTQQTRNLPFKIERRNITSSASQSTPSSPYPSLRSRATGSSYARQLYANSTKGMRSSVPQFPENNETVDTPQPRGDQNAESRRYPTPVSNSTSVLSGGRPERLLGGTFDVPHPDCLAMSLYRSNIMQQHTMDTLVQQSDLDLLTPSASTSPTRPRSMHADIARNASRPMSHSYADYIQASLANPPPYISTTTPTAAVIDNPASNEQQLSTNVLSSPPYDNLDLTPDHAFFSSLIDTDEEYEEEVPPYVLTEETPCYTASDASTLYTYQGSVPASLESNQSRPSDQTFE